MPPPPSPNIIPLLGLEHPAPQKAKRITRFQIKKFIKALGLALVAMASTEGLTQVFDEIDVETPLSVESKYSEAYALGKNVYGSNNRGTVSYTFADEVEIIQSRGTSYSSFDGTASTLYLASHSSWGNSTAVFDGNVNLVHEYSKYTGSLVSAAGLRMD